MKFFNQNDVQRNCCCPQILFLLFIAHMILSGLSVFWGDESSFELFIVASERYLQRSSEIFLLDCLCVLFVRLMIRWLYPRQRQKDMTLNCVCKAIFLERVEPPFIAITPWPWVIIHVRVPSICRIELFKKLFVFDRAVYEKLLRNNYTKI